MARGHRARARRNSRRAALRAQGVKNAQTPLLDQLAQRHQSRLSRLTVTGSTSLPLSDRNVKWDAGAAKKTLDPADFPKAFFRRDSGKPTDQISSYGLPFASKSSGTLTAIWSGVLAAAGAVQGARGASIPDSDVGGVKTRIERYYAKARSQYKDDSIKVPWSADESAGETDAYLLAYAELGADAPDELVRMRARLWEQELAMDPDQDGDDDSDCECAGEPGCECDDDEADKTGDSEDGTAIRDTRDFVLAAVTDPDAPFELLDWLRMSLDEFKVVSPADEDISATIPDDHQPGARTASHPDEREPAPPTNPSGTAPLAWSAVFAPEGKLTSDGRAFAPGAITWRDLPLTLMAMIETSEGGHIGAEVAGRIDEIWRDELPDGTNLIRAKGVFDDGEYGMKIAGLVDDQTLRGVSVDLAIDKYQTGPRSDWFDEDGNWAPKDDDGEQVQTIDLYSDDVIAVILSAEIGMTTVCPFPAFAEAKIAMGDSLIAGANPAFVTVTGQAGWLLETCEPCAIAASAVGDRLTIETGEVSMTASAADLVPERPPREWFDAEEADGPTPLTITEDGQIYGHAAPWNVCHIGMPNGCRTAPRSESGYQYFHLGEVECDDGSRVSVGCITLDTGHADLMLNGKDATAHYDDTGTVVGYVVASDGEHGIWVAGALRGDAPEEKVRLLQGAKLSGDWRRIDGAFELVALLAVNVPGFPVPRSQAMVAAADTGDLEPVALVAAGIPVFESELTADEVEQFRALQAHADFEALIPHGYSASDYAVWGE